MIRITEELLRQFDHSVFKFCGTYNECESCDFHSDDVLHNGDYCLLRLIGEVLVERAEKKEESFLNKQIITVYDAPEVSLSVDETAGEALLQFYQKLGWNRSDKLDPNKVKTTKAVYDYLYGVIYDRCPDPVGVGMVMINSGPSTDDHIPPGKVYLYEGWITPTEIGEKNENQTNQ